MVGPRSGIGSDCTAHAFLGGRVTRSGQPVRAARSLTVAPRAWRQNRSAPTKIRIVCKLCKPDLRNNPESMEIRLTTRVISRIKDFAGFQVASELVLS
ncbi:hypothetical protein C7S15_0743 [Burkholderia cepacia]|nr:hypothetical protein [Burkholderia cepacia]